MKSKTREAVVWFSNLRLLAGIALVGVALFGNKPAAALLLMAVLVVWNVAVHVLGDVVDAVRYDDEDRLDEMELLVLGFAAVGILGVTPLNPLHFILIGLVLSVFVLRHIGARHDTWKLDWLDTPVQWGMTYGTAAAAGVAVLIYAFPVLPRAWDLIAILVALVYGYFLAERVERVLP